MTNLNLLIACPECKSDLFKNKDSYDCLSCKNKEKNKFKIVNNIPVFMTGIKTDNNQKFWDEGWQNREKQTDFKFINLPDKQYKKIIDDKIKETFKIQGPISFLNAKKNDIILNIGCGLSEASGFSAMNFKNYIGIDFSFQAVLGSLKNIRKYNNIGITMQANAEKLPIKNNSIDIVFSSGVLHHTPNINHSLLEIKRVLKPGGSGIIGLYNSSSPKFIMAKLKNKIDNLFKKENKKWYENTETSWKIDNSLNPWTESFSFKQIINLFESSGFSNITIHKTNFQWGDSIPIIGKYLNRIGFIPKSSYLLRKKFGSMWVIIVEN